MERENDPDHWRGYQPGSWDQREPDDRTDILRFTSAVLDEDVEVTGPLQEYGPKIEERYRRIAVAAVPASSPHLDAPM